ncbi:MAG: MerR family DNA-binding protein [Bacteroidetes bacterium]|nr:MAG: MerR family DNA-binding protein [Bacteroidota bacterium]
MVKQNFILFMLIGELSKKSGVSRDTIRYYEKMGLLRVSANRRDNNYKEYADNAPDVLKMIAIGKNLGFKLIETKEFLEFWEQNDTDNERLTEMVLKKIEEIDTKIKALTVFKQNLENALIKCEP